MIAPAQPIYAPEMHSIWILNDCQADVMAFAAEAVGSQVGSLCACRLFGFEVPVPPMPACINESGKKWRTHASFAVVWWSVIYFITFVAEQLSIGYEPSSGPNAYSA